MLGKHEIGERRKIIRFISQDLIFRNTTDFLPRNSFVLGKVIEMRRKSSFITLLFIKLSAISKKMFFILCREALTVWDGFIGIRFFQQRVCC